MYLTVKGLVLRVTAYNDSDSILTLLTQKHGKLTVKARGLRRKNSPLTAPCQLLAFGEFTLFEYRGIYTINEAYSIELFRGLRKDLQKLSLGTYFAQVLEAVCQEDRPNPQLQTLTLTCLYALSNLCLSENQVKAVFELRCACLSGYAPELSQCWNCGNPEPDRFDISEGHLECSACRATNTGGIRMPISGGILHAIRYICYCDPQKLFSFTLPEPTMEYLAQLTEAYLSAQLERGFSTLDFYKTLCVQTANDQE